MLKQCPKTLFESLERRGRNSFGETKIYEKIEKSFTFFERVFIFFKTKESIFFRE